MSDFLCFLARDRTSRVLVYVFFGILGYLALTNFVFLLLFIAWCVAALIGIWLLDEGY